MTSVPICAWCKRPAKGLATIGDDHYCHEGDSPTCYELASWATVAGLGRDKLRAKNAYAYPSVILAGFAVDQHSAAAREFANWVATQRAYNGSEHDHGQSLYNERINAVLPVWADEWAAEQAADPESDMNACDNCAGTGIVAIPLPPGFSGGQVESPCPICGVRKTLEPSDPDDEGRLRDEEAEQILRAADDPNLPDDVFDVIEQILDAHVRSAESSRERAMHSRAEWRRRAEELEQQRDFEAAVAADAVAKLDALTTEKQRLSERAASDLLALGAEVQRLTERAWSEGATHVWESLAVHAYSLDFYLDDNPYADPARDALDGKGTS